MSNRLSLSLIAFFLFLLERLTKFFALHYLGEGFSCCHNFFGLEIFYNPGVAFGLPLPTIISLIVSLVIILCLIAILFKKRAELSKLSLFAGELVVIGASSNLLDKIYYRQIIDFIILGKWPVFNLADCFIVIGILLIIIKETRTPSKTNKKAAS
jgi:signal peptidase II